VGGQSMVAEVGGYSMVEAVCPAGAYDALPMFASHPGVYSWVPLRKCFSSGSGTLAVKGAAGGKVLVASSVVAGARGSSRESVLDVGAMVTANRRLQPDFLRWLLHGVPWPAGAAEAQRR